MKIIILGGGLSGLTCGLTFIKAGHEVVILEKEDELGGLARSYRKGPFTFDYGPHFLFSPKAVEVLSSLLERDFSVELLKLKGFKGKMYFDHRYFNFPFEPKNLFSNIRRIKLPTILLNFLISQLNGVRNSDTVNVDTWIKGRVGEKLYEYTNLGHYIEKLYGLPPNQISRDWGIQKLKFLNSLNFQSLTKKILSEGKAKQKCIFYPPTGIDYLSVCLGEAIAKRGGKIHLQSEVLEVLWHKQQVEIAFQNNDGTKVITGDFIISTMPVNKLIEILRPVPSDLTDSAKNLRNRTLLALFLMINRQSVTKHGCIYFSEKRFPFKRMTEFRNLSAVTAPEGKTALCIEMTREQGEVIHAEEIKEGIFKKVIFGLEKDLFLRESDVDDYILKTMPFAYPVYDLSYLGNLSRILSYLARFHNIVTLGRNGLFTYNTMANSIRSAVLFSQKISEAGPGEIGKVISDLYSARIEKYSKIPLGLSYRPNEMLLYQETL
jgi:protoporphyrinogen oxidase